MTFLCSASTKILESIFPTKTFFPIKIQDQRDVYRSFSLKTTSWSAGKERMFLIQHLYFVDAFTQMNNSPARLYGYLSLIIVSIAFFNFSGVSITKYMGATTRKVREKITKFNKTKTILFQVLDTLRTLVIWIASILLSFSDDRWHMPSFKNEFWLQLAGFFFVVTGIFLYSDLLIMPAIRKRRKQSG